MGSGISFAERYLAKTVHAIWGRFDARLRQNVVSDSVPELTRSATIRTGWRVPVLHQSQESLEKFETRPRRGASCLE